MKKRHWNAMVLATTLILSGLFITPSALMPAGFCGDLHNSRLSQLVKRKPSMYMPSRLLIGAENRFTLQGPAGSHVTLYLSPQPDGFKTPDGQLLRVGTENEQVTGLIPENGVLELAFPVPNEEDLVGKNLFVEAVSWKNDDLSDLTIFELVDSTGRRASENYLAISKPANGRGAMILPNLPGMPGGMIQRMTQITDVTKEGDPRKKDLIDSGTIDRANTYDRNMFINRPGGIQFKY